MFCFAHFNLSKFWVLFCQRCSLGFYEKEKKKDNTAYSTFHAHSSIPNIRPYYFREGAGTEKIEQGEITDMMSTLETACRV